MRKPGHFWKIWMVCGLVLTMIPAFSRAQQAVWHDSHAEAVKQAESTGKNLLVVFTGSEWIDICQAFEEEILSQPAFTSAVADKFVLVKLEFPEEGKMIDKQRMAEMRLLQEAYRVRGFPTVVFMDVQGRPFGLNGYQPISAEEYADQALKMDASHQELQLHREASQNQAGMEKARSLTKSVPVLPGSLAARYYGDTMKEVVALDPEETLDDTLVFKRLLADAEYSEQMEILSREVEWSKMLELTDRYIQENELTGQPLQRALLNKAAVLHRQGRLQDRVSTLLQIVDIEPESSHGEEAKRHLEALRMQRLEEETLPSLGEQP